MRVKKRNLIELIFQCVIAVFVFIPNFAVIQSWEYKDSFTYHGIKGLERSEAMSLVGMNFGCGIGIIFGVLFYLALIAGIVFAIKQYMASGGKRNSKIVCYISIAEIVLYAANSIACLVYTYDTEHWYDDVIPDITFFLLTLLVIASTVIIVLGYKKVKKLGIKDEDMEKSTVSHNYAIEDLKKLKDLLDSGVITQEEFDAKKNQILGL